MEKKKILKSKPGQLMTKELNKAIMTWSRLHNKYLKKKSIDLKIAFNKQKNYWVNLLLIYFFSSISDYKKIW